MRVTPLVTARTAAVAPGLVSLLAGVFLTAASGLDVATPGPDLYVDGGCEVGGDGTVVSPCTSSPGARGPFNRIAVGLGAMGPGRTLHVRGRHDRFDGVYHGEYLGIHGEHHLDCRASRCTIRGYENERPVISGFKVYSDWRRTSPGSPVWFRDMERHDECQGLGRSGGRLTRNSADADWDPQLIVQDRNGIRVPLRYNDHIANAGVVEEGLKDDGSWWHDLPGHRSYVNPYGDGDPNRDPAMTLLVPQEQALIVIEGSGTCGPGSSQVTHNLLVKQIALEGPRSKFVEVNGNGAEDATDIRFEAISMKFTGGRFGFHAHHVTRFSIDEASSEWIGRGMSWADHTHGFRLFQMNGAALRGITCRHLGLANRGRRVFLDPPWGNSPTSWWAGGTCIQVKQSNDVMLRQLVAEDLSLIAVALDVSRRTVLDGFDIRRAAGGVVLLEYTPAPSSRCDERNETHFCHNYDDVIRNGVIHASGLSGPEGAIVVDRNRDDPHKKLQPGQFTAKIYNVAITYPGGVAVMVRDLDAVSVWNVSIYGEMGTLFPRSGFLQPTRGIMLEGDVRTFESRNNIFAQLGDVAIDVEPTVLTGAAGVSFDHDLFDPGGSKLARWKRDTYSVLGGARGFRETGQERHGKEGSPRFKGVPGSLARRPDLHVAPGSPAEGMGANLSRHFETDADGRPRRTWDDGAYAVSGHASATGSDTSKRSE